MRLAEQSFGLLSILILQFPGFGCGVPARWIRSGWRASFGCRIFQAFYSSEQGRLAWQSRHKRRAVRGCGGVFDTVEDLDDQTGFRCRVRVERPAGTAMSEALADDGEQTIAPVLQVPARSNATSAGTIRLKNRLIVASDATWPNTPRPARNTSRSDTQCPPAASTTAMCPIRLPGRCAARVGTNWPSGSSQGAAESKRVNEVGAHSGAVM